MEVAASSFSSKRPTGKIRATRFHHGNIDGSAERLVANAPGERRAATTIPADEILFASTT